MGVDPPSSNAADNASVSTNDEPVRGDGGRWEDTGRDTDDAGKGEGLKSMATPEKKKTGASSGVFDAAEVDGGRMGDQSLQPVSGSQTSDGEVGKQNVAVDDNPVRLDGDKQESAEHEGPRLMESAGYEVNGAGAGEEERPRVILGPEKIPGVPSGVSDEVAGEDSQSLRAVVGTENADLAAKNPPQGREAATGTENGYLADKKAPIGRETAAAAVTVPSTAERSTPAITAMAEAVAEQSVAAAAPRLTAPTDSGDKTTQARTAGSISCADSENKKPPVRAPGVTSCADDGNKTKAVLGPERNSCTDSEGPSRNARDRGTRQEKQQRPLTACLAPSDTFLSHRPKTRSVVFARPHTSKPRKITGRQKGGDGSPGPGQYDAGRGSSEWVEAARGPSIAPKR